MYERLGDEEAVEQVAQRRDQWRQLPKHYYFSRMRDTGLLCDEQGGRGHGEQLACAV